ncbi:hypothetical protein ACMXYW_02800 [Neptuniibacter sp. QD48_55]|uniref:hypothetical protein n=1 Tax=Neptuniibacter sp. QD48_55 TaxID=3398212 RepID=UPI0039F55C41
MVALAITLTGLALSSFFLRAGWLAFSISAPLAVGAWLISFDFGFGYRTVSFETIVLLLSFPLWALICESFVKLSNKEQISLRVTFESKGFNYFDFFTLLLLFVGVFAFLLKVSLYFDHVFSSAFIKLIIEDPELIAKKFASGYSSLHYLGFLGLVYLPLCSRGTAIWKVNVVFTFLYLITLLLLMIKVQIVLAFSLLLWSFFLTRGFNKKFVLLTTAVVFIGVVITLYDNYKHSNNFLTSFEFLLRYLGGSVIGLDYFLNNREYSEYFSYKGYFCARYNPVFNYLGMEQFEYPDKVFINIGDNAGTVNTGTMVQSFVQDFGVLGACFAWIITSVVFYMMLILSKGTSVLSRFASVYVVFFLASCSVFFIGNAILKLEIVLCLFVHLMLMILLALIDKIFSQDMEPSSCAV